jgi:hypothetical protein
MPAGDAPDRQARLIDLLDEAATLLNTHGETQWTSWLAKCKRKLGTNLDGGLDYVLGAFGGMGSFNDLVVIRLNGYHIQEADEAEVNDKLGELRTNIWAEATALRRQIRRADNERERAPEAGRHAATSAC